jgi:hypothetical protein
VGQQILDKDSEKQPQLKEHVQNNLEKKITKLFWVKDNLYKRNKGSIIFLVWVKTIYCKTRF